MHQAYTNMNNEILYEDKHKSKQEPIWKLKEIQENRQIHKLLSMETELCPLHKYNYNYIIHKNAMRG